MTVMVVVVIRISAGGIRQGHVCAARVPTAGLPAAGLSAARLPAAGLPSALRPGSATAAPEAEQRPLLRRGMVTDYPIPSLSLSFSSLPARIWLSRPPGAGGPGRGSASSRRQLGRWCTIVGPPLSCAAGRCGPWKSSVVTCQPPSR